MTELIFEELPARENENRYVVGFRMCKRKNWKYRYVMLHHITNPAHEEYGNWIIMTQGHEYEYFEFKEEGKQRVKELLEQKRQEFITGKRNWWTGKLIGGAE